MFSMKVTGPGWTQARSIFRYRRRRAEQMQDRFLRDFMGRFKSDVEKAVPRGAEFKPYKNAIQERQLRGSFRPGERAYALIVEPEAIRVSELDHKRVVLYPMPAKDIGQTEISPLSALLIQTGPWITETLPINAHDADDIKFMHRNVTEEEVLRIGELNRKIVKGSIEQFKEAGARFERKKDEDEPEKPFKSMPDLVFLALRAEFGIKRRREPHWGAAIRSAESILKDMISDRREYAKFVCKSTYVGWVRPLEKMKALSVQRFNSNFAKFQSRLIRENA